MIVSLRDYNLHFFTVLSRISGWLKVGAHKHPVDISLDFYKFKPNKRNKKKWLRNWDFLILPREKCFFFFLIDFFETGAANWQNGYFSLLRLWFCFSFVREMIYCTGDISLQKWKQLHYRQRQRHNVWRVNWGCSLKAMKTGETKKNLQTTHEADYSALGSIYKMYYDE